MKTIFALAFATALSVSVISCGPSATEIKADSVQNDSTAKSMNNDADRMIDSMNRVDSINTAMAKHKADSMKADSAAKAKANPKKK